MKHLSVFLMLALLLSLSGCGRSGADAMTVLYLDVGKADCTILTDGAHTVLIDCAEADDGETVCRALRENRFFFAGDIEKQRIADLLETGVASCDVLKVPHHGVYNKQLPALFAALGMKEAVITCSEKDPADEETLAALDALGCRVWQTVNGTVRVVSDQNGLTGTKRNKEAALYEKAHCNDTGGSNAALTHGLRQHRGGRCG